MSGKTVSSGKRWVYAVLVLLSVCGTAISVWNLIRTFQGTLTVMGVLQSVIQVLAHLAILGYVCTQTEWREKLPSWELFMLTPRCWAFSFSSPAR